MTLTQFANRIIIIAERVERNADNLVKILALNVSAGVIRATPVDTGKAKSNWQVKGSGTLNQAIEAHSPGVRGSTSAQNFYTATRIAIAKITNHPKGQPLSIVSYLDYIEKLNKGSSKQAPSEFVQHEALAAVQMLVRVNRILR